MHHLPEKLYQAEQVREMDRVAIDDLGFPGIKLMRNAGYAVFQLILKEYSIDHPVLIFTGAGNNAGDGFVIALLAMTSGYQHQVISVSDPEKLTGDAQLAYQDYAQHGGTVQPFDASLSLNKAVIVDALLGTGLNRPVDGNYADAIRWINNTALPVIAVDIPSGLNADKGNVMGIAVKAAFSVSFIALKQGMFSGQAAEYCGKIIYHDLGLDMALFDHIPASARLIQPAVFAKRNRCAHKGHFGHVLIVGGDQGYSGAGRLAAEAALRTGAGRVSLATHASHAAVLNLNRPEMMVHALENEQQLKVLIAKADVIALGPGLGQSEWSNWVFKRVMCCDKPMVVDADGLNLLAQNPEKRSNWVLTPHPGEAARLTRQNSNEIEQDRFHWVSLIQQNYGGVVLLKGAGTLVAGSDDVAVSTTGNPGMASGGMGDSLTGIIAAMLAQSGHGLEAVEKSVYLHGAAADAAAQEQGEIGLLASDVIEKIRSILN